MKNKYFLFFCLKWGVLLVLVNVFIILPTSVFESNNTICLIKNIFGVECFGCGTTRAISSLFHGNFINAYSFNKLIVITFPTLIYICVKLFIKDIKQIINLGTLQNRTF